LQQDNKGGYTQHMITNTPFSQTNPTAGNARTSPSLAGEITNLNNELNSNEDTIIQGYVREGATITYLSNNSFSTTGNTTGYYTLGRYLRINVGGTPIYVTVLSSSYNGAITTVTTQETTLTNPVSTVDIAIQPKGFTNPKLYSPAIATPTITGGTQSSPTITTPTVTNPTTSTGTFTSPTVVTPVVTTEYDNGSHNGALPINWSNGDRQRVKASGGNITLSFLGAVTGQVLTLWIVEDGIGGNTITLPTILWSQQSPPSFVTTVNAVNVIIVRFDGTNYYGMWGANFA
jgi:hypothetical protein